MWWFVATASAESPCDPPPAADDDGNVILAHGLVLCDDVSAPAGSVVVPQNAVVDVFGELVISAREIRVTGTLRAGFPGDPPDASGPGDGDDAHEPTGGGGGGGFGGRGGAGGGEAREAGGGPAYELPAGDAIGGSPGGGGEGGRGGLGGPGLTLRASERLTLEPVGAIEVDGEDGGGTEDWLGGGGGGSGGGLVLDAPELVLAGTLSARGGAGGDGSYGGGGGGGGRILAHGQLLAWPIVDTGGGEGGNTDFWDEDWRAGERGFPGVWLRSVDDADADDIDDRADNCAGVANAHQADADEDGLGDLCDPCPSDPEEPREGVCASTDLCAGEDSAGDEDGDGWCADLDPDDRDGAVGPGEVPPEIVAGASCATTGAEGGWVLGVLAAAGVGLGRRRSFM